MLYEVLNLVVAQSSVMSFMAEATVVFVIFSGMLLAASHRFSHRYKVNWQSMMEVDSQKNTESVFILNRCDEFLELQSGWKDYSQPKLTKVTTTDNGVRCVVVEICGRKVSTFVPNRIRQNQLSSWVSETFAKEIAL